VLFEFFVLRSPNSSNPAIRNESGNDIQAIHVHSACLTESFGPLKSGEAVALHREPLILGSSWD